MAQLNKARISEAASQHKANIAASLSRRMEAARAANNQQLLDILEQERQQLIPDVNL